MLTFVKINFKLEFNLVEKVYYCDFIRLALCGTEELLYRDVKKEKDNTLDSDMFELNCSEE